MSQPNLDQMNALLEGNLSEDEHRKMVEAILANPEDAKAFRALHALQQSFEEQVQEKPVVRKPQRIMARFPKFRYALGVAAVLTMAVSPYLFSPEPPNGTQDQPQIAAFSPPTSQSFQIAHEVKRINLLEKSKNWGSGVDTRHLIDLTNQ
jgi:hypothetical protein